MTENINLMGKASNQMQSKTQTFCKGNTIQGKCPSPRFLRTIKYMECLETRD